MRRFLPIVLLLLPLSSWATSGSVMHHVTDSAFGSAGTWSGVSRQGRPVVVSSDGDVYTMFRNYTGGQGNWVNYWAAFGTTSDSAQYGGTNGVFGATRGEAQSMLYSFYDSIYALNAAVTDTSNFKIRKYVNGVGVTDTTASSSTTTGGDRPGIVHTGTALIVTHITEDSLGSTADTMRAYISSGAWGSHTWTQIGKRRPPVSTGLRVGLQRSSDSAEVGVFDMNQEDYYSVNAGGISGILEASLTLTDRNVPGFYRYDVVPFGSVDTFLQVWQEDTTGANGAIKARPAYRSGAGVVFDTAAEITVVATGSFPSKFAACPTVTWFPGTDSGMIIWRDLVVTNDTICIWGKVISRYGKTYGADTLLYKMPNTTRRGWGLMASNTWINGNTKNFVVFMQDSLVATADSARALFCTYDTGDPTPVAKDTTSTVYLNSKSGHQPQNSKTGPAYVNKK